MSPPTFYLYSPSILFNYNYEPLPSHSPIHQYHYFPVSRICFSIYNTLPLPSLISLFPLSASHPKNRVPLPLPELIFPNLHPLSLFSFSKLSGIFSFSFKSMYQIVTWLFLLIQVTHKIITRMDLLHQIYEKEKKTIVSLELKISSSH